MSLDADLLAAIDARIAAAAVHTATTGTVVAVQGVIDAMVTFDGSTLAVPVKIGGDVSVAAGDRVGLVKFGLWWVIVMTMTRRFRAHNGTSVSQSLGSTTSATYVDLPTVVSCTFVKQWDTTRAYVELTGAGYITLSTSTSAFWGAKFSSPNQAPSNPYDISQIVFNTLSEHLSVRGERYISSLPADTYTVTAQWLRGSGTGTLNCDGGDWVSLTVQEVSPT